MKKLLTMLLSVGAMGMAHAQLVNNAGTIIIEANATLVVESDVTNNSGGTITNNGTMDIKGDLSSLAGSNYASGTSSTLKFSGNANSNVNLPAGASVHHLEMAKTDADLILGSDVALNGNLTFTNNNNQIKLGANDLELSATSAATTTGTNAFVVTDGAGKMTKKALSGQFTFPVGATETTQNDLTLTQAGTVDDISVRVLADAYDNPTGPTGPKTEDVVAATWEVTEATAGGSDLTVVANWTTPGDETTNFDRTMSAIYAYEGSDYNGIAAPAAATVAGSNASVSNAGYTSLDGTGYLMVGDDKFAAALLAVKMFLQGPYNTTNNLMNDALRTGGHIPTGEPYAAMTNFTHVGDGGGESVTDVTEFDAALDGDDVVDWVFVELRNASNTTISTKSALLQRDGDIVDTDGGAVKFSQVPSGDYDVVVRHRNHLGVKSASPITITKGSTVSFDFTSSASQTQGADVPEVATGVFGAWAGDSNADGQINSVDLESHWRIQNGTPFNYSVTNSDYNFDASINSVDLEAYWRVNNSKTSQIDN